MSSTGSSGRDTTTSGSVEKILGRQAIDRTRPRFFKRSGGDSQSHHFDLCLQAQPSATTPNRSPRALLRSAGPDREFTQLTPDCESSSVRSAMSADYRRRGNCANELAARGFCVGGER